MKRLKIILIAFSFVGLFNSCDEKQPDIKWNYSKNEITNNDVATTEKLNVDIYLDVTTSMEGFVSEGSTNYSKLIEDLEATCQNVWKKTDITRYKFGKTVEKISRDELLNARTSKSIYTGAISQETNFDGAINNINPKRVSILITDLFYNKSDVNRMVNSLQSYCVQKGVEIGVVGLTSNFSGFVCDVQPCVSVTGSRPFYVIIMGDNGNINLFFKTFKNHPYINASQFYLITDKPAIDFKVSVLKDKECKTLNKQSLRKELQDLGTVFKFRMKEKENKATFNLEVNTTPNQNIFPFTDKNLKIDFYKKNANSKDSTLSNELSVRNLKLVGNKITATIELNNNDINGKFSYLGCITFDNTVTPLMPQWIKNFDTESFGKNINETKTLNLSKLLTEITTYNITYNQPRIAKFYINIEKQ